MSREARQQAAERATRFQAVRREGVEVIVTDAGNSRVERGRITGVSHAMGTVAFTLVCPGGATHRFSEDFDTDERLRVELS